MNKLNTNQLELLTMLNVGVGVVLSTLERPQEELGCWLREARIGLGPRTRTRVVLCVVLQGLKVQVMRTSRGLVGASDI